ncbi:hypothetical protein OEZ85_007903 [Tetradesmus obliquus]|uniref:Protein kinase domain-containing protein n=1 Tax=Tetradesmus obliquus TaxID=3088 RepID=A0ABY8TJK4_TETOB|nr:hypothetical protein OEZ85_007903 [Tetradesmus obliquus]
MGWEEPADQQCALAPLLGQQSSSKLDKIVPLGSGSFAEVHLVRHQDGRLLAYKQIKCSRDLDAGSSHCAVTIEQAKAEAALHASLDHPNVVKFEEFCWEPELGMLLEYCSSGSLKSLLDECRGPSCLEPSKKDLLPLVQQLRQWPARLELLRQAADAVSYLHRSLGGAVLHNDLRADNMLLHVDSDGSHTLKLADFGLAFRVPADAQQEGCSCVRVPSRHVTNPRWVAPEVIAHASDDEVVLSRATDVYSLAAVMAEVLTATPPHFPYLEDACVEKYKRHQGLDIICTIELENAAKKGTPILLRFPEPDARLPCPQGGVGCTLQLGLYVMPRCAYGAPWVVQQTRPQSSETVR